MPAKAARAFSRRCNVSGTLRIWIIVPMRKALKACGAHVLRHKGNAINKGRYSRRPGGTGGLRPRTAPPMAWSLLQGVKDLHTSAGRPGCCALKRSRRLLDLHRGRVETKT